MGLELLLVLTKILSAKVSQIKLSGFVIQLIICQTLGGPPIFFLVPSSFIYPQTGYYLYSTLLSFFFCVHLFLSINTSTLHLNSPPKAHLAYSPGKHDWSFTWLIVLYSYPNLSLSLVYSTMCSSELRPSTCQSRSATSVAPGNSHALSQSPLGAIILLHFSRHSAKKHWVCVMTLKLSKKDPYFSPLFPKQSFEVSYVCVILILPTRGVTLSSIPD